MVSCDGVDKEAASPSSLSNAQWAMPPHEYSGHIKAPRVTLGNSEEDRYVLSGRDTTRP